MLKELRLIAMATPSCSRSTRPGPASPYRSARLFLQPVQGERVVVDKDALIDPASCTAMIDIRPIPAFDDNYIWLLSRPGYTVARWSIRRRRPGDRAPAQAG